ncbi:MAG: glycoside hydrolase family 88 protein, partial [Phaeodactylibacter sp.]|nr:glycoside hydrolase family 88 protein [Phaeodactylibacter sp.]
MKRIVQFSGWMVILIIVFALPVKAQTLPAKKDVLEKMCLANAYFMKKWPDVGKTIITNKERPSNIWTRAVYYEGLMALYEIDPQPEFYDYAVRWAEFHNWDLRDGNTNTRNA